MFSKIGVTFDTSIKIPYSCHLKNNANLQEQHADAWCNTYDFATKQNQSGSPVVIQQQGRSLLQVRGILDRMICGVGHLQSLAHGSGIDLSQLVI